MKCQECGLEMVIYQVNKRTEGGQEIVYACRNKRCPRFDRRLKPKAVEKPEPTRA